MNNMYVNILIDNDWLLKKGVVVVNFDILYVYLGFLI